MSHPIPIKNNKNSSNSSNTSKRNRPQSSSWSLYGSSPGGSMYINGTPTNTVDTHIRPIAIIVVNMIIILDNVENQ